jgi:hypothetical protein
MRFACRISKATDTQNKKNILVLHGGSSYADAPNCYVYAYIAYLAVFCIVSFFMRACKHVGYLYAGPFVTAELHC